MQRKWKHIELADLDLDTFTHVKPTILLEQDNSNLTLTREFVKGPPQEPIISLTKLGWVIYGNNAVIKGRFDSEIVGLNTDFPDDLHELVKSFFTFEAIGVKHCADKVKPHEEIRALEIMQTTTKRIAQRFETGHLWKYDNLQLPESKSQVIRRLKCVERKKIMPRFTQQNWRST
ncbi:unnamed protein product [Allacma fusca]|uniref:Uncharacterized protein n=1 Tax=Allacma fusca TaxID=39272 RepID=A0A8J2JEE1_9HEXA|nr:unnamed protein product [Allacma fusca]